MSNSELNIVLKVTDQATAPAQKAIKDVGNEAEKASQKTSSGFLQARKAIQDFHKEMFVVGIAFGVLATAINEWAKRNDQTRDSLNEIALATSNLTSKFGEYIQKHTLIGMAFVATSIASKEFNNSVKDEYTATARATEEIRKFNDDLNKQKTLFVDGKMSAEQYYNELYRGAQSQIMINQQAAQSMQQLASLTAQINNKELMDARNKTNEQMNLLKFYEQTYMTAQQGMSAFTVTVGKAIQTNMSAALTSMITGAKSAKEAFSDLGKAMVTAIVDFMVQKVVAWVLEKTLLAGTIAASIGAAATIAAAWAPAAALVSAATFGASAVAGAAALSTTAAISSAIAATSGRSISVQSTMSGGGQVLARAKGGDDYVTRPTLFLAGEAGPERVRVDPQGSAGYNGGGGNGGITINISAGNIGSNEDIKRLVEAIGFEIDRTGRFARSFA
jgi:hypothetical protein